ncbi:MAG: tRNA adenosine(34) deaminase TadA [Pseudomonadales bacterium]
MDSTSEQLNQDQHWMKLALLQAKKALAIDEVPVGAVLVRGGKLIAEGYNQVIDACDPSAHAEVVTLRAAAQAVSNYRLPGATLYVTIEPCAMCAGAIVHARVARVVFGANEPKAGCLVSHTGLLDGGQFNHSFEVTSGVFADECGNLMSGFFAARR